MVNKSLVEDIKGMLKAEAGAREADEVLKSFELIKQLTPEVDYLKVDVEESDYTCQIVFSDVKKEYWISISKGKVEYGAGKRDNPSVTITTSKEIGLGLFLGEVDANIISPLGKLGVGGNFTQLRLFQELYEDVIEEFRKNN